MIHQIFIRNFYFHFLEWREKRKKKYEVKSSLTKDTIANSRLEMKRKEKKRLDKKVISSVFLTAPVITTNDSWIDILTRAISPFF